MRKRILPLLIAIGLVMSVSMTNFSRNTNAAAK